MALTQLSNLYAVKCGSTLFHQLQDATLNSAVQDLIETPIGSTIPLFNSALQERPDLTFSSCQIKDALTLFGVAGGDAGISKLLGRKIVNKTGPAAVAGTVHHAWSASASMGVINSISAGNRQKAMVQLRIVCLKNGATAALVYAGGVAVDAYTTAAENWVLGPIAIGGAIIEGTNDFSLAFNAAVNEPDDDYEVEPVFVSVDRIQPLLTFTTTAKSIWSLHNTAISATLDVGGVKANLIKLANNGKRIADATTSHIVFRADAGRIVCESVSGTKQLTRVRIVPISKDGTTAPVTATVDSAITTT